ncbi:MAG TPA: hypothetical protein VK501_21870 [Baekduia sp.]|nr:hypothetical protein [Baekduia sp.]HMJ36568.1 hypothetical protein [Baekduia sp.]
MSLVQMSGRVEAISTERRPRGVQVPADPSPTGEGAPTDAAAPH